jgi:hypothetical protein
MSLIVLPSLLPGASSGSSLLTLAITTLLIKLPLQLSVALATSSLTVTVWYWWFGGHSSICAVVVVICGASVSLTVTVKLQLGPACVLQVTVVVPTGKNEPDDGLQVTVPQPPPEVVGEKETTAPHWPGSLFVVMLDGQVIEHGTTVTVNEHVVSGLSGLSSEAVQVTVVVPGAKQVPDGGVHVTVALPQLSVAVGFV